MSEQSGIDFDIEWLHTKLNEKKSEYNASSEFEIRLTIADLKELADSNDIFTALSQDFVIATRNKDGMSGKIYLVDNLCEIATQTSPTDGCETAHALGQKTFIDLGITNSRWGWQLMVNKNDTLSTPIYAGAAQNDISKGEKVGTLNYSYKGSTLLVTFNMDSGFGLQETHLYAGTSELSVVAPGLYGNQHQNLVLASSDSYSINVGPANTIYVAAHAVSCPKIDDGDDTNDTPNQTP